MQTNDATRAQQGAADPASSVWLSANAGSGKTKVLTDRVARLLLEGVPPERILCLTYTKAAASEMQNRLFRTLGAWAMQDDSDLQENLLALGLPSADITAPLCRMARTLFARAIETPGGLKIQTIHSFCAGLLRRFPLEAAVSPQFQEMDGRAETDLRAKVLREMAEGPDAALLYDISRDMDEAVLPALLSEVQKHRGSIVAPEDFDKIGMALGLRSEDTLEELLARTLLPDDPALLTRLRDACRVGSTTDQKAAAKLDHLLKTEPGAQWFEPLESLFLWGAKAKAPFAAKTDAFPTKKTQAALGPDQDQLNALMSRIQDARETRLALGIAGITKRVHRFAHAYLHRYEDGKQARGWLDFDDLIYRAQRLLTDPSVAQWVLFRLDGGIDHMLVDEAQDTSPLQWDVIRLLTREFTAGEGARADVQRTIFVVGDQKQSIYSFQGADPDGFDRMRAHFETELIQVGAPFQERRLLYSFRSAPPVLRLVDTTFAHFAHKGLGAGSEHLSFHRAMPGRVDLWPALPRTASEDLQDWTDPVDAIAQDDARLVLARDIAAQIRRILDDGTQITQADGTTRLVTPGDFLILVQRRSEIFHELIRACKAQSLPIAGADRLRIGAELAVKDLMAMLAFAALQEDDLALACVLRSPLCGWSLSELHKLAQPRGPEFLWQALRAQVDQHTETVNFLKDIRDQADFQRPYDLLERILTRHGGREKLVARLGAEAEEGIDVLLSQALQYEQAEIPSLTGFVTWFRQDEMEVKRQIDATRDEIRVMTVHGAKGLEAPIVILPDCSKPAGARGQQRLIHLEEDGPLVWAGRSDTRPAPCRDAAGLLKTKAEEERMRLLYVAMTRAESWLIVAAAGDAGQGADSWHSIVAEGMNAAGATPLETPVGTGTRLEAGAWPENGSISDWNTGTSPPEREDETPIAPPPTEPDLIAPSDLGGAKVVEGASAGLDKQDALLRGTRVHVLLENLPLFHPNDWSEKAKTLLSQLSPPVAPEEQADLTAEALDVLRNPDLSHVFAPDTLAEVPITSALQSLGNGQVLGTIDRLLISEDLVLAIDYKTNADVPNRAEDVPEGILRQMGAYAEALGAIYPNHGIETAILWTRNASLMSLPHGLVIEALQRSGSA